MAEVLKKRLYSDLEPADEADAVATTKRRATAVSPIFPRNLPDVKWSTPFGETCLLGEFLEQPTPTENPRVILFDLDGTLIVTKSGKKFADNEEDWKWFSSNVPAKLRELHTNGYSLIILSNQFIPERLRDRTARREEWKKKLNLVAHTLYDVPFRVLAATARDQFRKPMPGSWQVIQEIFKTFLEPKNVIFVGNAAGRKHDHSGADRKFAQNLGLQFYTPEEYFLDEDPLPFQLTGFHPSSLPTDLPLYLPSSSPLLPPRERKPIMMVFVGPPAMGKTRAYNKYFKPAGYVHIDKYTLQSKRACVIEAEKAIKEGKSVVIDDINHNKKARLDYIDLGLRLKADVRCLLFGGGKSLAMHNNLYRAFCLTDSVKASEEPRGMLEEKEFTSYDSNFEPPTKDEGFKSIKRLFWRFEGTEADKERYMRWLKG